MKTCKLIRSCAMVLIFMGTAFPAFAHRPHPIWGEMPTTLPEKYTVREDARVLLEIPYDTILQGEHLILFVGIQNFSDTPIKLMRSAASVQEYQAYYQARSEPEGGDLTRPESIPFWERLEFEMDILGYEDLNTNDYQVFDRMRRPYSIMPEGTREMRVGFLVGPNEWVFSDWVSIHRIEGQHLHDGEVIKTVDYRGLADPLPIRMKEVKGDRYLFFTNIRFARVPTGATPRFEWDAETRHLTVHFDGVDISPLLFYSRQLQTLEWIPETAPHMVAREALKAELESARDADVPTPEPDTVTDPPSNDVQPEPEAYEYTVSP